MVVLIHEKSFSNCFSSMQLGMDNKETVQIDLDVADISTP